MNNYNNKFEWNSTITFYVNKIVAPAAHILLRLYAQCE